MSPNLLPQRSPRPCPVCDSVGPRRVLHPQRFFEGPLGDGYDVVVCGSCGAGFADGIPGQEDLDRYYAERSKYTYAHNDGAESLFDLKRFEKIADQVEAHLPDKAARILDIGCATGGLLAELKKRGYRNLVGSDPAPACAEAARRIYSLDVRTAALREHESWSEHFDAVLLVGVLEHLRDVGPLARIAAKLLVPDGFLYCAQPDVETFAECVNAPYQQFSVEHVNFFSAASMTRMMAGAGLAPREIWHWQVEWRECMTDSVLSGVYGSKAVDSRASSSDHSQVLIPENLSAPSRETTVGLERYLSKCRLEDRALVDLVERLVNSREPILVWGTGTLTRRLLAMTRLREAAISAFVDANPLMRGQLLAGRPILEPEEIVGREEAIFVCSKAFELEIVASIRERFGESKRVILLP